MEEYFEYVLRLRDEQYDKYDLDDIVKMYSDTPNDVLFVEVIYKLQKILILKVVKYEPQIDRKLLCSIALESIYKSLLSYNGKTKFITYAIGNVERSFINEAKYNNAQKNQVQYHTQLLFDVRDMDRDSRFSSDKDYKSVELMMAINSLKLSHDERYIIDSILCGKMIKELNEKFSRHKYNTIIKKIRNKIERNPEILDYGFR